MIEITIITAFLAIVLGGVGFYRTSSRFAVEKRIEQIMAADAETSLKCGFIVRPTYRMRSPRSRQASIWWPCTMRCGLLLHASKLRG